MIGMNQIKKRLLNGILIGAGVGLVMVIVVLIITNNIIKGYEEGTNADFKAKYFTKAVVFTQDVVQGQKVTEAMLSLTEIPKTGSTNEDGSINTQSLIGGTNEAVGKMAKYNISAGAIATPGMFTDTIVAIDERIQEINTFVLPSDLAVGEYVDIRLMYPSGVEYIVLTQKLVKDIVNTTVKLDLTEEEILKLNGAIVDSYMTDGTKLYAVKYVDPATQLRLDETKIAEQETAFQEEIIKRLEKEEIIYASGKQTIDATTGKVITSTTDTDAENTENTENVVESSNLLDDIMGLTQGTTTGEESTEITEQTTPNTTTTEGTKTITKTVYSYNDTAVNTERLINLLKEYAIEYRYYAEANRTIESNYQPNETLMAFMNENAYVLKAAKEKLSKDARKSIESSMINFKIYANEQYDTVVSEVNESVSTQKSLRQSVMGATTAQ